MNTILKAVNLRKSFATEGNRLELFNNLSVEIEKEKITVIVGASGAGKSTLLHLLSGLDRPDAGDVYFNSIDIYKLKDEELSHIRNTKIGFVFQFHHLLPEFTAMENVALPALILGESLRSSLKKAEGLLSKFGLIDRANHKPSELSGGEQQRVAIARALINDPEIIFADEPTGNLDSKNSEIIHSLFIELRDVYKKTILLVTHNNELMKLGDVTLRMKDGELING